MDADSYYLSRWTRRSQPRPYCVYVACRVDLPANHIGRLIRYSPRVAERIDPEWVNALPDLSSILVEILGYALFTDINAILGGQSRDIATEHSGQVTGDFCENVRVSSSSWKAIW